MEMETVEEGREGQLFEKLLQSAILNVFNRYFSVDDFTDFVERFKEGRTVEVSETTRSKHYLPLAQDMGGLAAGLLKLKIGESPGTIASAAEFILEGLHLHRRLNKEKLPGRSLYRG
jgi:magnesium chelatase subunit I